MRLIDADAVLRSLPDDLPYKGSVRRVLIQAATVDAVPVVRCEDCQFWEHGNNECESWEYCKLLRINMPSQAFCGYGNKEGDHAETD